MLNQELIDLIHDTPFDVSLWGDVMERISDAIGGESACLTELDVVTGAGGGMTSRVPETTMDDYVTQWATRNPLHAVADAVAYVRDWTHSIIRDREWMDRDELVKTPFFNEFLRPIQADHGVMIRLGLADGVITSLSIGRAEHRGTFDKAEVRIARGYQRHMIQAVRTAQRVSATQEALDDMDALLASSSQPLFFVDGAGRVRRMTAAAEQFLREEGVLAVTRGTLRATAPREGEHLARAVRAIAAAPTEGSGDQITLVSSRSGRLFDLTVSPLGRRSLAALTGERHVLVAVRERPAARDPELYLRAAFALTVAEARVACAVAAGVGVKGAAERLAVSSHTVRAQLGAVYAKTGVHRQSELARLIYGAASPA